MNTEILDKLKNVQHFVSQKDIEIAKFLGIANSKIVFISILLPKLAKLKLEESFSRKLALTILETGALDYGNCELKNIINSFIETFVQKNTIDAQFKGREKDKKLEKKIVKIEQSAKSEQGIELPIPEEESLTSKEFNVIKDKKVLQEGSKSKIKTNCKQISILDEENLQRNEHKSAPVVFGPVDELVGSLSRAPGVDTNRKRLLQKKLTLKIDDEAFDIFAVTETNLDRKEGFFVGKKVENFKFFWSNTSIYKRKGLGIALDIKYTWKKYLEDINRISEFIMAARFYFRNMELIIIMIYILSNNRSEMDK
ncbi:397_t:CDS:2, partial [Gigaspora margarita]